MVIVSGRGNNVYRHPVERLSNCLKHFRRVATPYNKLDSHFLAFIRLAATVLRLREG